MNWLYDSKLHKINASLIDVSAHKQWRQYHYGVVILHVLKQKMKIEEEAISVTYDLRMLLLGMIINAEMPQSYRLRYRGNIVGRVMHLRVAIFA